jgi:hypothetical protein
MCHPLEIAKPDAYWFVFSELILSRRHGFEFVAGPWEASVAGHLSRSGAMRE